MTRQATLLLAVAAAAGFGPPSIAHSAEVTEVSTCHPLISEGGGKATIEYSVRRDGTLADERITASVPPGAYDGILLRRIRNGHWPPREATDHYEQTSYFSDFKRGDVVVVGELTELTMTFPDGPIETEEGGEISITNACGFFKATFRIKRPICGATALGIVSIEGLLGKFCRTPFKPGEEYLVWGRPNGSKIDEMQVSRLYRVISGGSAFIESGSLPVDDLVEPLSFRSVLPVFARTKNMRPETIRNLARSGSYALRGDKLFWKEEILLERFIARVRGGAK